MIWLLCVVGGLLGLLGLFAWAIEDNLTAFIDWCLDEVFL